MIYKKPGEKSSHKNITYTVGNRVLVNETSEYGGLFGRILEIRTDDDRETENDTPNIYCRFDPLCLFAVRRASEQTLSELYDAPKRMEDLGLELVITAFEMLTPLAVPEQAYPQGTLYVVISYQATDGEFGSYGAPSTNSMDAQRQLHDDLKNEPESGCIEKWREKSQFAEEGIVESYECYLDEEYCGSHFYLSIEKWPLPLVPEFIRTVAATYEDECIREDFLDKAQALPEYLALTKDQKKQLLRNADIKRRISHYLDLYDVYQEYCWDAVSKAAQDTSQDSQQAPSQKQDAGDFCCEMKEKTMDEKELRKALGIHLNTPRRDLEVVSLEVLKTKYQKPYEELRGQIYKAATEYTRHVAPCDTRIRRGLFDEAKTYIDAAIQQTQCPKKTFEAIFQRQGMDEIAALAHTLREGIEKSPHYFYLDHMCLLVTRECVDDSNKAPEIYNKATSCVWRDGAWLLMEDTETAILLSAPIINELPPTEAATQMIQHPFKDDWFPWPSSIKHPTRCICI